jgi:hypothetical protein
VGAERGCDRYAADDRSPGDDRQDSALGSHPTLLRMVDPWFRGEARGCQL